MLSTSFQSLAPSFIYAGSSDWSVSVIILFPMLHHYCNPCILFVAQRTLLMSSPGLMGSIPVLNWPKNWSLTKPCWLTWSPRPSCTSVPVHLTPAMEPSWNNADITVGVLSVCYSGVNNTVADSLSHTPVCTVTLRIDYFSLSQAQSSCSELETTRKLSSLRTVTLKLTSDLPEHVCDISLGHPCPFVPDSFWQTVFDILYGLAHPDVCSKPWLVTILFGHACMAT